MSKPYNNGTMTEAQWVANAISALRKAFIRWGPRGECIRNARVGRGLYKCNACKQTVPSTTPSVYKSGKKKGQKYRRKNTVVDHIEPVVPVHVKITMDNLGIFGRGLFCEMDNLQLLCHACHQEKCAREREERKRGR